MPNVNHSVLTDPNLHEPKGIATAAIDKVYVADGVGGGDWLLPAGSAYGEIYISGGTTAFILASASAYTKLAPTGGWGENGHHNITLSGSNSQFTVLVSGVYYLNFWAHFTTAAAASGSSYNFKYAVNGTTGTRLVGITKPTNGTDGLNVHASGLVTLSANDVISMYVAGDGTTSGTAITVKESGLSAIMLKVA